MQPIQKKAERKKYCDMMTPVTQPAFKDSRGVPPSSTATVVEADKTTKVILPSISVRTRHNCIITDLFFLSFLKGAIRENVRVRNEVLITNMT